MIWLAALWLVLGVLDYWKQRLSDLRLSRLGFETRFAKFHPLDILLSLLIGPFRQLEGPLTVILAWYDDIRSLYRGFR